MTKQTNLYALARTQIGVAADECLHKDLKLRIKGLYSILSTPTKDLAHVCDKLSDIHKSTFDPVVKSRLAKAIDLIDEIELTYQHGINP